MKELDKLPMDVLMSLYRQKLSAEKKGNRATLIKLEQKYPDLFSPEFDDFIFNLRMSIEHIYHKYGEDFKKMIEPEELTYN
jgi:hypothetical protein